MKKWNELGDKARHAIVGFVLATVWIIGAMTLGESYATATSQSIALLIIVGGLKEAYDFVSSKWFGANHTADIMDMFATVAGALPYFIIGILGQMGLTLG